jgi:glycerol-3-phosphate O-acyltransferase/dihydroxyacetone phosphate acyltransferase
LLPRIITRLVGWAVAVFYDVERSGPWIPDGPVLVAANHPNALVDPLVIFHTAGRATRPLGKAPLFEHAIVGTVLKGLGGLPVYRREDDPQLTHLNERTFDAAIEALHAGGAIQIYPEGYSHSGPSLSPLRTGAARIALMAEERRGWKLGVKIQPVGLTYTRKHRFRGRAVALFGEPFEVALLREAYERDPREAVRSLTAKIQQRLERLTLNFDHPEDAELVDVAERLYARHKKLARPRERPPLVERMPRLQRFAEGVRWLRHADPERLARLRAGVRRYLRLLTLFGASEGDVPTRYRLGPVLRYSVRQLVTLALVLPIAVVGAVLWVVPLLLTRHIAPRFQPRLDQIATYKVGTALVAFPVWYAAVAGAALLAAGVRGALLSLVVTPVAGMATIAWKDRQAIVREDVRVFFRAVRRSEARDRLREQRADLVAEFDALTDAWQADRARRPGEHEPVRPAL